MDVHEAKDDGLKRKRLTVVCACIALCGALFWLWNGVESQERAAFRNRTATFHKAIMAGLENYRAEYGEYPSPVKGSVRVVLDGHDYETSGALMLYQALTGDGGDHISTVSGSHLPSDGRVTGDEVKRVFMKDMPEETWRKTEAGWLLVDGYGHPFQYTKGGASSVNATYDLWSFGETDPADKIDKESKQAGSVSGKWITNW